jgi:photosystem II stability/assembly factor-like uncharacterized protein
MKQYLLLLFCSLCLTSALFGQNNWQWLNPKPEGYTNVKVVFADRENGFVLNINGDLIVTADQGNTWRVAGNFPGATCLDIHDNTGVIASYLGTLFLSTDNGNSWAAIKPDTVDQFQFVNVVSQDSFFVSTVAGTIYFTGDRGQTWAVYHCGAPLACLSWVNSITGFAGSSNGSILKTADGGKTWAVLNTNYSSSGNITAINFPNADTGYAIRFDTVLVTYNGGNSWQGYYSAVTMTQYDLDFVNADTGFMCGEDGSLYRSTDGGRSWAFSGSGTNFLGGHDLASMAFLGADTGFAVGALGQIWKTVDAGQSWTAYAISYIDMSEASFPSSTVGYAVNRNNIFKTTDGGASWVQLALTVGTTYGSNTTFQYVHFSTPDSGYAITTNNVAIYKTNDGGQTWNTIIPTGYSYESATGIWYGGGDSAVLCLGTALVQTTDGGNTWPTIWTVAASQASGPPYILGNIFYVNANVWFATYSWMVYKTTNGGQSWSPVFTNSLNYGMTGLWFFNAQQGFVADEEGFIFQTTDGGANWQTVKEVNAYDEGAFNGIVKFFNSQVGYMTNGNVFGPGYYGRVYKTVDGGQTWQMSHNTGGVTLDLTADSSVVVAGYGGSILKEAIGGWQVDSLAVSFNNSCGTTLTASVGASLGVIDSIAFEVVSAGGKTTVVEANPNSVANNRISINTTLNGLLVDTLYSARLKFQFNGVTAYSDTVAFTGMGLVTPLAIDSMGVLISTADAGNQWFLNGSAITGATGKRYKPTKTGSYTVQTSVNSCVSAMSNTVVFRSNDLGVIVFPNPTHELLNMDNTQGRSLTYRILDMTGRTVMAGGAIWYYVNVASLDPGEYILELTDTGSGQRAGILFLKL